MSSNPPPERRRLVDPKAYSFADNLTLDLHDIATILLRERQLTEPWFKHSQLLEVCNGGQKASRLPDAAQITWTKLPRPKLGYLLKEPVVVADDAPATEPQNFLHPEYQGDSLDQQTLDTIFWHIKHHNSGYILPHALQLVLDALPESTTLRVRTSSKHSVTCNARSHAVAEINILPNSKSYICNIRPRPELGTSIAEMKQYHYGDGALGTAPWVYLVFGDSKDATGDVYTDRRVAVDLVAPLIGLRGLGNEPFVMERIGTYHQDVLSNAVGESEKYELSARIYMEENEDTNTSVEIAMRVLSRLQKITRDEEGFCAYCGKENPNPSCSKCLGKTRYCDSICQKMGWKYHKSWCKIADTAN